jgi:catalase
MESRKILTTDSGAPVTDQQNSRTSGSGRTSPDRGPSPIEKLAHFDRFMKAATEEFQS